MQQWLKEGPLSKRLQCQSNSTATNHMVATNTKRFISSTLVQKLLVYGYSRSRDNQSHDIPTCIIDLCFSYYQLQFRDYGPKHIARCIEEKVEEEFRNDIESNCDLYKAVFDLNLNGVKLVAALSLYQNYLQTAIKTNKKNGHGLTKLAIRYILKQYRKADIIRPEWTCHDVFRFLYFAESEAVKNAVVELGLDGIGFLQMDESTFRYSLAINVSKSLNHKYYKLIV